MEYPTVNQHRSPQSELFDLLDRLQSARLDDQRCELPNFNIKTSQNQTNSDSRQTASKQMLQRILKHPPPYPTVALVNQGSHWIEPNSEVLKKVISSCQHQSTRRQNEGSAEDSARLYRLHFAGYEHFNFAASDIETGQPLVLSIKVSDDNPINSTNDGIHGGLDYKLLPFFIIFENEKNAFFFCE